MKWAVYMLDKQGSFSSEELAKERKEALERTYKGSKLKFEVRQE